MWTGRSQVKKIKRKRQETEKENRKWSEWYERGPFDNEHKTHDGCSLPFQRVCTFVRSIMLYIRLYGLSEGETCIAVYTTAWIQGWTRNWWICFTYNNNNNNLIIIIIVTVLLKQNETWIESSRVDFSCQWQIIVYFGPSFSSPIVQSFGVALHRSSPYGYVAQDNRSVHSPLECCSWTREETRWIIMAFN